MKFGAQEEIGVSVWIEDDMETDEVDRLIISIAYSHVKHVSCLFQLILWMFYVCHLLTLMLSPVL